MYLNFNVIIEIFKTKFYMIWRSARNGGQGGPITRPTLKCTYYLLGANRASHIGAM